MKFAVIHAAGVGNDREQRLAGLHELADLDLLPGTMPDTGE